MKKFDSFIHRVDRQVDPKSIPGWNFIRKHFTVFSTSILVLLVLIAVSRLFIERPLVTADIMHEQIASINKVLNEIDRDCNILTISGTRAPLDFFTVEKFVGSTVGCFNLAHPERWKGPYFKQNPTIQGKVYDIVRAYEGFCVVPGKGVLLPNGHEMGKDLIITADTPVTQLFAPSGALYFDGSALGAVLTFKIGDWDSPHLEKKTIDRINQMWREFNSALPYAFYDPLSKVQRC